MAESPNVTFLPTNTQRYLDDVALQLKQYPKQIIYRFVPDGLTLRKLPHCWHNPAIGEVDAFRSLNWGSFEQCANAAKAAGPWFGVGIVLDIVLKMLVMDVDYRLVDDPDNLREIVSRIKATWPTITETSVSGNGEHLYYYGTLPQGWQTRRKGFKIYSEHQFIAITGKDTSEHKLAPIPDELLDLIGEIRHVSSNPVVYKEIDYPNDEAVIAAASKFIKGGRLLELLNTPEAPGNWSEVLGSITLALASSKCTKENAYLTLCYSPFVQQSEPNGGQTRETKLNRRFWRENEWERAVAEAAKLGRFDDQSVARSMVFPRKERPVKMVEAGELQIPQVDHSPKALKPVTKTKDPWLTLLDDLIRQSMTIDQCVAEFKTRGFEQDEDMIRLCYRVVKQDMVIVARAAPMDHARKFVEKECMFGDVPLLRCWLAEFYYWNGSFYKPVDDAKIRSQAWYFLDNAVCPQYDKETDMLVGYSRLTPTSQVVSNMLDALKAITLADHEIVPAWLRNTVPTTNGKEWISFINGIYHLERDLFIECNPYFFNTSATDVAFDRNAPPPVAWLQFLKSVWEDDQQSIDCLQDISGYLLSSQTNQQKIFGLVGPARSGKGTILRVIKAMIGQGCVSTNMQQLGNPSGFGLENLIGASVAMIPDAMLSGRTDSVAVSEYLKNISGEDETVVGRKHKKSLTLRLGARFVLAANEVLALQDRTGVLASRLIMLQMSVSWLGKEDLGLEARLMGELSGILNWSLEGLRRLRARGRFIQPATGEEAVREAAEAGSSIISFVRDRCEEVGQEWWTTTDRLYAEWVNWHMANNQKPGSKNWFVRELKAAYRKLKKYKPKLKDGKQYEALRGIKVNSEVKLEEQWE